MKTLENVQAATLTELAAFYNLHNEANPIKKFADRKSAERRVMAIIESLAIIESQGGDHETGILAAGTELATTGAPADAAPAPAPVKTHKTRASRPVGKGEFVSPYADIPEDEITPEMAAEELRLMREHAAQTKAPAESSGLSLSDAIRITWQDPSVAAARTTRDGVQVLVEQEDGSMLVSGEECGYKSVAKAFTDLKLPMSKHIRFRKLLKTEGKAIFEWQGVKYHFSIA